MILADQCWGGAVEVFVLGLKSGLGGYNEVLGVCSAIHNRLVTWTLRQPWATTVPWIIFTSGPRGFT